jgi:hypothetical protein
LLSLLNIHLFRPLPVETLRRLQQDLQHVRFLFIDEMSMIGLKLFSCIDHRLREIFPHNRDLPFGGLGVVLCGDFAQLPPVLDTALYASIIPQSPPVIQHASRLYKCIPLETHVVEHQNRVCCTREERWSFACREHTTNSIRIPVQEVGHC